MRRPDTRDGASEPACGATGQPCLEHAAALREHRAARRPDGACGPCGIAARGDEHDLRREYRPRPRIRRDRQRDKRRQAGAKLKAAHPENQGSAPPRGCGCRSVRHSSTRPPTRPVITKAVKNASPSATASERGDPVVGQHGGEGRLANADPVQRDRKARDEEHEGHEHEQRAGGDVEPEPRASIHTTTTRPTWAAIAMSVTHVRLSGWSR